MNRLLRSSLISHRRQRRLALALVGLGLLLVAAAVALGYRDSVLAAAAQERHVQSVFLHTAPEFEPPFLTAERQGLVYAPGQTVLAFAEGFQPHETLFVRLYSLTQGLVDSYQTLADLNGQVVAARPLSLEKDAETYTPPGALWFQVEGLSGKEQLYRFRLEPGQALEPAAVKGVYPTAAVPGSVVAFWCSGLQPGAPVVVKTSVDGQTLRPGAVKITTYPVSSDSLLLGTLVVSLDDPTGEWELFVEHCRFHIPVRSRLHARPELNSDQP